LRKQTLQKRAQQAVRLQILGSLYIPGGCTPRTLSDYAAEFRNHGLRMRGRTEQICLRKGAHMTVTPQSGSAEIERAVVRKILWRLVPCLAILYVFNMLDRGNVAIAAIAMKRDLHFSDGVYGLGAGMFFIGYFLFEVPSNLIMERVGARPWIARIMISWGAVSSATMFVHTPLSFNALRFLLGLAEAGFYPGIILYLTYWVPGRVRTQVIARFLALTSILGLFGGPLGGLLLKLNGQLGLAGWQWLFLLEGLPTILLGFVVLKFLPNGPEQARWLSAEEKSWITDSLVQEAKSAHSVQHLSLRVALSDPRILHLCLIFIVTSIGLNAIGFFGPQLIQFKSGGTWSDSYVATIGIIPALVGAIAMLIAANHSDRTGNRRNHVVYGYLIAGIGYLLCVYAPNAPWVLVALSLNALGERSAAGSYWTLTSNLMGARAAAGGIAFINSVGNLGGFIGPILMGQLKQRTFGSYTPGLFIAAALLMLGALSACRLRRPPAADSEQNLVTPE